MSSAPLSVWSATETFRADGSGCPFLLFVLGVSNPERLNNRELTYEITVVIYRIHQSSQGLESIAIGRKAKIVAPSGSDTIF